nr:terminase gpA endonuclease subunit [Zooshikella ganghwensis]
MTPYGWQKSEPPRHITGKSFQALRRPLPTPVVLKKVLIARTSVITMCLVRTVVIFMCWNGRIYTGKKANPTPRTLSVTACDNAIEEKHKGPMVAKGQWRSLKLFGCCEEEQKPKRWDIKGRLRCRHYQQPHVIHHAGFHIWAAYSPMSNATWPKTVEEWEEVKGDPEEEKTFINTVRGETYREDTIEVEWKDLYEQREPYGDEYDGKVPEGVRFYQLSNYFIHSYSAYMTDKSSIDIVCFKTL